MKDVNGMSGKEIFEHVASGEMQGQGLVVHGDGEVVDITANVPTRDNLLFQIGMQSGKAQMSRAISRFADVAYLETLRQTKEAKEYKGLRDLVMADGTVLTGTWTEYCLLIGSSRRTVDERLANLITFGDKALTSMQAIGMGVRDLRKLRALPEDAQKAIVDGDNVQVDNKEDAVEIIKELSAEIRDLDTARREEEELHKSKNQKYIDTIVKLKGEKKGYDKVIEGKNQQLSKLEQSLAAASGECSIAKTQQLIEEQNKVLNELIFEAKRTTQQGISAFKDAIIAINEGDRPADLHETYQNAISEMLESLMQFGRETGLDQTIYEALQGELEPLGIEED